MARLAKGLRLAAALVVMGGVAYYAARAAAKAQALHVNEIRVRGNQHLAQGEVLALLEGLRGQHILLTSLETWRRRLLGSAWVEHVELRRVLPSTIEVQIRERRPMALARLGNGLYLVDEEGLVIDDYGPNYAQLDLPIVDGLDAGPPGDGPTVDPMRAELAGRTLASLASRPALMQRVSQVDVKNPRDAVLLLENDPSLLHVGDEQFAERVQTYLTLSPTLHARVPDIEYVDLRFADRVYVRPSPAGARRAARPASPPGQD
jgi:cell division protein FtsQ